MTERKNASLPRILVGFCAGMLMLAGCGIARGPQVLAVVDGSPITEQDVVYALNISHRRELSKARSLDLDEYMNRIVDDKLIAEEARLMGMNEYPELVGAVDAFILRESVVRLHQEEVLDRIIVTDADALEEFRRNYVHFGIIEVAEESEIRDVAAQLQAGASFSELAKKHSIHQSKSHGGEIILLRDKLMPELASHLSQLKKGEVSSPISAKERFFLVKVFADGEPRVDPFARIKDDLIVAMKKKRQKEREDAYLAELRSKAAVVVNRELLAGLSMTPSDEQREKWLSDGRDLASVNGETIAVKDFAQALPVDEKKLLAGDKKSTLKSAEEVLDSLIDFKVVNHEALRRKYAEKGELKGEVERYRMYLLKNLFMKKVIVPRIAPDESKLKAYYEANRLEFSRPTLYHYQQILLKTREDADNVVESLKYGTDFWWLAKSRLGEDDDFKKIDPGWLTRDRMPAPYRDVVSTLKQGEVSGVIETDNGFAVVRLIGRQDEDLAPYDLVQDEVRKSFTEKEFQRLLAQYLQDLRKNADISIDSDAVRAFEKRMR